MWNGDIRVNLCHVSKCDPKKKKYEKRILILVCLTICLFFLIEQLDSHWTDFSGILNKLFLPKSAYTTQVLINLKKKSSNKFTRGSVVIYDDNPMNSSWIE